MRPLWPKPTSGATLSVTGVLSDVRQWAVYTVCADGETWNENAPLAFVVVVRTGPAGCEVRVTGSFVSWFDTDPVSVTCEPYLSTLSGVVSATAAGDGFTVIVARCDGKSES